MRERGSCKAKCPYNLDTPAFFVKLADYEEFARLITLNRLLKKEPVKQIYFVLRSSFGMEGSPGRPLSIHAVISASGFFLQEFFFL
jgi:hypothetical protein